MIDDHKKTLKALHDLVATCNDAAEGYGKAAKGVHDRRLGDWLAAASGDRERFGLDLTKAISDLGGEAGVDLHEGGILHRGWVDLEQQLRSKDDHEIVRECIAGDSGSLKHYDHALQLTFPPEIRTMLLEQRTTVDDNLIYLQSKASRAQHS